MNLTQLKKTLRIVAPWAVLVPLLACGWMQDVEVEDNTPSVEVAADDSTGSGEATGGGGGACSRVQACCRAYVQAMGATVPANTCDAYSNVANMPDSLCESTISGYRSGLAAMQKAIPADCN